MSASNLPILIGGGQVTVRSKSVEDFVPPVEIMKRAVEAAAADAFGAESADGARGVGPRGLLERADGMHVVNLLSWRLRDAPAQLSESLGISPATLEYTSIGGNNPQWLVNRIADRMMAGETRVAIIAGCEVLRSVKLGMKVGKDLGAFRDKVERALVGVDKPGTLPVENQHQADRPVRIYPLIENALRAAEVLSIEAQREHLGRFAESFSAVAAANPHSWFPVKRTAAEATAVGPNNRMISWPYTKYLNAVMEVDMAGAVVMTTTDAAREMGVPEDRWVYLHGGADAMDHWFLSERPDIADSPAIRATVSDALAQAGVGLERMNFFDLYSCFPVMPRLTRRVLGMSHDDPRPMTVTGGLPYFGGPGNNYVTHSIVEAMNLCRADRSRMGMVTSNGFYSTKHGVGIYGGEAPARAWSRTPPEEFQKRLVDSGALGAPVELELEPSGEFRVESYTVWHGADGAPETGILVGRVESGKRAWANTRKGDRDTMDAMMREEFVGRRGRVVGKEGNANVVEFA